MERKYKRAIKKREVIKLIVVLDFKYYEVLIVSKKFLY